MVTDARSRTVIDFKDAHPGLSIRYCDTELVFPVSIAIFRPLDFHQCLESIATYLTFTLQLMQRSVCGAEAPS